MNKLLLSLLGAALLPALTQCNTLEKDIAGINARNAEIAREPRGNYFVGRRYHVPATRFWGYLRQPGQTWRTTRFEVANTTPGWLFKPSEKYDTGAVTLRPAIMPSTTSLPVR